MANTQIQITNIVQEWLDDRLYQMSDQSLVAWLNSLATEQSKAIAGLVSKTDDGTAAAKVLTDSMTDPRWEQGRCALPLYRALSLWSSQLGVKVLSSVKQSLENYEATYFRSLSDDDVVRVMAQRLLSIVRYYDLSAEMGIRYLVDRHWDDGAWLGQYLDAIEANQELLGGNDLILDNHLVPPTVANWMKDFMIATAQIDSQDNASVYGMIKYVNQGTFVSKLSEEEKSELVQIIRLFDWLRSPTIDEQELLAYDRQFEQQPLVTPDIAAIVASMAKQQPPGSTRTIQRDVGPELLSSQNLQDLLRQRKAAQSDRPGVVFDNVSNVQMEEMAQRIEAERQRKQVSIDQKLEALKKRQKTDS